MAAEASEKAATKSFDSDQLHSAVAVTLINDNVPEQPDVDAAIGSIAEGGVPG
jgi:hypothetical protein